MLAIIGVGCMLGKPSHLHVSHLIKRFIPYETNKDLSEVLHFLYAPFPMSIPINHITPNKARRELNSKKPPS